MPKTHNATEDPDSYVKPALVHGYIQSGGHFLHTQKTCQLHRTMACTAMHIISRWAV